MVGPTSMKRLHLLMINLLPLYKHTTQGGAASLAWGCAPWLDTHPGVGLGVLPCGIHPADAGGFIHYRARPHRYTPAKYMTIEWSVSHRTLPVGRKSLCLIL